MRELTEGELYIKPLSPTCGEDHSCGVMTFRYTQILADGTEVEHETLLGGCCRIQQRAGNCPLVSRRLPIRII